MNASSNILLAVQFLVAIGTVGSAWLAGKKKASGWALLVLTQATFTVYTLITGQIGFIVQNIGMASIGAWNLYLWRVRDAHPAGTHAQATPE